MSTVEEAVDDVDGLHSKIDRKKNVDTQNATNFSDFKKVQTMQFIFYFKWKLNFLFFTEAQ